MDGSEENVHDAQPGGCMRSKVLVVAAELERRKRELSLRLDQLEERRRAFLEIRDSLAEEEQVLAQRLTLARRQHDRIVDDLDSRTRRTLETAQQIEGLKRRMELLDRRCSENSKREMDLEGRITSAEQELMAARRQFFLVTEELATGREALARMDRRISDGRSKR